MWRVYLKNLQTGEEFHKEFESPYLMNQFLIKCRYSKKIKSLGKVKLWG